MTATVPAPARHRAVFHPLRVAAVDRLTDDAVAVTFDVPAELRDDYAFLPGQHVVIVSRDHGDDVRRSYSICAPATSGTIRIAIKQLPAGVFSTYALTDLAPGDVLDVMTPGGRFCAHLDPANAKHYVAVAAGSGITPILSIIATALEVEPDSRVTLLYGNRTIGSVMFLEELEDLKNRYPARFSLFHVLSREPQEVDLLSGRIDGPRLERFLDSLLPADDVDEWFLCGPMSMVEQLRATLLDRGVEARRVHRELFHTEDVEPVRPAKAAAVGAQAATVTVRLDGRTTTLSLVPEVEPILDALLRVRADAPYACKGGVCGTCRAKLVEGEVEMTRNYALEDDERAAGFVLACQSYPKTPQVSLDFDQ